MPPGASVALLLDEEAGVHCQGVGSLPLTLRVAKGQVA